MNPELHAQMIFLRRLERLVRMTKYGQDGRGEELSPKAMRLVEVARDDAYYHACWLGAKTIADIAVGGR